MTIERLEGKFKMSQNRPRDARIGVISALESLDTDSARRTADTMRTLMSDGEPEPKL